MAGPIPLTTRLAKRLKGVHGNNSSTWKPHQNKRECARRLVQLVKHGTSGTPGFISEQAQNNAHDLRLRVLGLVPPGKQFVVTKVDGE